MRAKIIERIFLIALSLLMIVTIALAGVIAATYYPDTPREYTFLRQLVPRVTIEASGFVVVYPDGVTITTEGYVYEK